jgi:hypothetical protein
MSASSEGSVSSDFVAEMERKYFWWEPVDLQPRSEIRILAQAMDQASFTDIRRLEIVVGPQHLIEVMRRAEPGWLSDRSWELWRGRLALSTRQSIAKGPPRRSLYAAVL